jgi:hypothetical protein
MRELVFTGIFLGTASCVGGNQRSMGHEKRKFTTKITKKRYWPCRASGLALPERRLAFEYSLRDLRDFVVHFR